MPLEVRELVIKAQVGSNMSSQGTVENNHPDHNSNEDMIQQCVEKVLEIIKEKSER